MARLTAVSSGLLIVWLLMFSGCYTQFALLEEGSTLPGQSEIADSARVASEVREREVCFWERTFWGEWELRCYTTTYPNEWFSYYHRPWWYQGGGWHEQWHGCHCPYHRVFHPRCQYCWYYCNSKGNKKDTSIIPPIPPHDPLKDLPRPPIRPHSSGNPPVDMVPSKGGQSGTPNDTTVQPPQIQPPPRPSLRPSLPATPPVPKSENPTDGTKSGSVPDVQPPSVPSLPTIPADSTGNSQQNNDPANQSEEFLKRPSLRRK